MLSDDLCFRLSSVNRVLLMTILYILSLYSMCYTYAENDECPSTCSVYISWAQLAIHHLHSPLSTRLPPLPCSLLPTPRSLPLSSLRSVVLSCFLYFPFLFSYLLTLPCSASMLPWQQSYRKRLLPRPHERSSFHKRRKDGEIQGFQLWGCWSCHFHCTSQLYQVAAGFILSHDVFENKC